MPGFGARFEHPKAEQQRLRDEQAHEIAALEAQYQAKIEVLEANHRREIEERIRMGDAQLVLLKESLNKVHD